MRDINRVVDRLEQLVQSRDDARTNGFRMAISWLRKDLMYLPPERANEGWLKLFHVFNGYVSTDPSKLESLDYDLISEFTTIDRNNVQRAVQTAWSESKPIG